MIRFYGQPGVTERDLLRWMLKGLAILGYVLALVWWRL